MTLVLTHALQVLLQAYNLFLHGLRGLVLDALFSIELILAYE